eukprot:gb/GEZN01022640.1/.p1 GENE.gb/GEZN01022640.1/~~gb/GEZN01022640.1/.p1  ORF type:complete len:146 (+),score=29.15 gb/GEZN01022640.1/:39-476(+)
MPLSAHQRAVCAEVSRKIFGTVGYTGINVRTGRKQIKKKVPSDNPLHVNPYKLPGMYDIRHEQRRFRREQKNEHLVHNELRKKEVQETTARRKVAIEYSDAKKARLAEEEAIMAAAGGRSRRELERDLDKGGEEEEEPEEPDERN